MKILTDCFVGPLKTLWLAIFSPRAAICPPSPWP